MLPKVRARKLRVQETIKEAVLQMLQHDPFVTQASIAKRCNACVRTVRCVIDHLRWSRKRCKKRGVPAKPASMPALRRDFASKYMAALRDGVVVSIDESGFSEQLVPLYGYSRMGEPLVVKRAGSWKHQSLLMAIFSDGRPAVYTVKHGAIKSSDFNAFVTSLGMGSTYTLLMDNASIHNKAAVSTVAQVLRTPPYSPECNPIELAFARIKHSFRSDFHEATTRVRLERAVESLEPGSCPALFQHVSVVVRDPAWVAQPT